MKQLNFKKSLPYLIAVTLLMAIAMWFFNPALKGYSIIQNDIIQSRGMSNDIVAFRDSTGIEPQWTNGMFSGMPATQISVSEQGNFTKIIRKALYLGLPEHIGQLFVLMLGFFFMALCMRINVWIATVGAIAYAFSSFFIISIEAGHVNKVWAIAFIAPIVGSFIMAYRGQLKWGILLSGFFMMLQLGSNHVQITYYTAMILSLLGIYFLVKAIRSASLKNFALATGGILAMYVLAALSTAANLLPTQEYTAETTRGKNNLTINASMESNADNKTSGLDRDYIVQWSLGKSETATLFNPYAKGGHSVMIGNGELAEQLKEMDEFNNEEKQFIASNVQYFGDQPFTSGPVYIGGLVLVLALLGVYFIQSGIKWAFLAAALLSLFLAWGKNMMWFTDLFLDYVPMYSKFRAVTMILIVLEFAMPALLILTLHELWKNKESIIARKKEFLTVSSALFGLFAVLCYSPGLIGMTSEQEREKSASPQEAIYQEIAQQVQMIPPQQLVQYGVQNPNDPKEVMEFVNQVAQGQIQSFERNFPSLITFRKMIYNDYGTRTLVFILFGLGLVLLYLFAPGIKAQVMTGGLGLLVAIDLIGVNLIYMPNQGEPGRGDEVVYEKWTKWEEQRYPHTPKASDLQILENEMSENPSLAKRVNKAEKEAKRYAGEMEFSPRGTKNYIENERFRAYRAMTRHRVVDYDDPVFSSSRAAYFHESVGGYHGAKLQRYQNLIDFNYLPFDRAVLNMLNVKYLVRNGQVEINPGAMGNAWLTNEVYVAKNEDDEILNLGKRYALTKQSDDWKLVVNGEIKDQAEVYAREKIFMIKGKDSVQMRWPDGLPKGAVAYYVEDARGTRDWIPESTLEADNLNSFKSLLKLQVNHNFTPAKLTIIPQEFSGMVNKNGYSGQGNIEITKHQLNHLTYAFDSQKEQLVVFSEIYYKPGWQAFIDGKAVDHIRVNYVLRGLVVPAGKHTIEFKVNDATYKKGLTIARISSWLMLLLLLGVAAWDVKTAMRPKK